MYFILFYYEIQYTFSKTQVRSSKYGHNTVIFGLIDGYYGAAPVLSSDEVRG